MATNYKQPPLFNSKSKPYKRWKDEIEAWVQYKTINEPLPNGAVVCDHGLILALSLPEEDESGIRDKVFNSIKLNEMKALDGVTKILVFMDTIFKEDELTEAYSCYTIFDKYRRPSGSTMDLYVAEFDRLHKLLGKFNDMKFSDSILGFKLLECADLELEKQQIVLTGVDYTKPKLYEQMGKSLKKFYGKQCVSSVAGAAVAPAIKVEPTSEALYGCEEQEYFDNGEELFDDYEQVQNPDEAYFTDRGYRGGGRFRGRSRGYRPFWRSRGMNPNSQYNQMSRSYRPGSRFQSVHTQSAKRTNPIGSDGQPLRCSCCDSFRHLLASCPDSWENLSKSSNVEKVGLYTGNASNELLVLVSETSNHAVVDTACNKTVAGQIWIDLYLDSLDDNNRDQITYSHSDSVFRFGGDRVLRSLGKITFPCSIAGTECTITTDIVDSTIPLLLSKESMKKAGMKLDLTEDKCIIFEKEIDLTCTSSGHYAITLDQPPVHRGEMVVLIAESENKDLYSTVSKLHKQFCHPSSKRLSALLKDAGFSNNDYHSCVKEVTEKCEVCLKFKKTPARPVVCLPLATEFNQVVAMDLKVWDKKKNIYFLHMIDLATRFCLSVVIRNKNPPTIINKVVLAWIGSGPGAPGKFLADNGGEFANSEYRDMCENLNVDVANTPGQSPWSNGTCERNHAVIDDCVHKVVEDNPGIDLEVALVWALNAKNSLQMVNGFSPYQLVFGTNPKIPSVLVDSPPALEGTTISETFAEHLNSLHSGRRAFIQAEASERIRRALRHQIRASNTHYETGDTVYYKRDDNPRWKGPGKVIGQDGKVVFVRHGNVYVRVHPNRLVKRGEEFSQCTTNENDQISTDTSLTKTSIEKPKCTPIEDSDDEEKKPVQVHDTPISVHVPAPAVTPETGLDTIRKVNTSRELPTVGSNIEYILTGSDTTKRAKVVSRAGKATGKNWAYMNIENEDQSAACLNFTTDIEGWKLAYEPAVQEADGDVLFTLAPEQKKTFAAKESELQKWKKFRVYEEVENDGNNSKKAISTRWVISAKENTDKEPYIKARLVARGFESRDVVQSDSPTAGKESTRTFFAMCSSQGWTCKSIDVTAAFLQGHQIDREVYLIPPEEAKTSLLWRLNKCVYGLSDASRKWYTSVVKELLNCGCIQSKYDMALFYWYSSGNGAFSGILIMHVDDFLWAGDPKFELNIINKLRSVFEIGCENEGNFRYLGLEIEHKEGDISVHQETYARTLSYIVIVEARAARKHDPVNQEEEDKLREVIGQLTWLSDRSRPDLSFGVLELSLRLKHACVEDLLTANKLIKRAKDPTRMLHIKFPRMSQNLSIHVYSDASYANLSDGFSSAEGYLILLNDDKGNSCPVGWTAKKIRRVVKSTIAAESLALVDAVDEGQFIASLVQEMTDNVVPVICYIDNKSLFENLQSTKAVAEKRLRVDIAALKQMVQRREITIKWVSSENQLADGLTKKTASCHKLVDVIQSGYNNSNR